MSNLDAFLAESPSRSQYALAVWALRSGSSPRDLDQAPRLAQLGWAHPVRCRVVVKVAAWAFRLGLLSRCRASCQGHRYALAQARERDPGSSLRLPPFASSSSVRCLRLGSSQICCRRKGKEAPLTLAAPRQGPRSRSTLHLQRLAVVFVHSWALATRFRAMAPRYLAIGLAPCLKSGRRPSPASWLVA